ncbi:MAG: hypothetical protein N2B57_02245 [Planctomycetales bacterium]
MTESIDTSATSSDSGGPKGFHFTNRMRSVCEDMASRLPQLAHIQMDRVAISFCQARKSVSHGLQASLTPMRFEDGDRELVQNGQRWRVQQIRNRQNQEMLYLLNFYLPRFQDQPFGEKLVTILHELWHINPTFNGDLRRLPGRCYVHSASEKKYDAFMGTLANEWLARNPSRTAFQFLEMSFDDLQKTYGQVSGLRIPAPKMIRCG